MKKEEEEVQSVVEASQENSLMREGGVSLFDELNTRKILNIEIEI